MQPGDTVVGGEHRYRVLRALRVAGLAPLEKLATICGLPVPVVEAALVGMRPDGLAHEAGRTPAQWTLTGQGRACDRSLVGAELEAAGCRGTVTKAYERFLAVNPEFLQLCTDWQMGGWARFSAAAAEEEDPMAHVLERLWRVHDRVQQVCHSLSAALPRFGPYERRLADALRRFESGERDALTGVRADSYHLTWFDLHEDLLTTLDLQRTD
jgi:hypothetical protein